MKEISLYHAELIMLPFSEHEAEHYGYDEELFSLDLVNPVQAEFAIGKWLVPHAANWSAGGRELRREASRICISQDMPFSNSWLPGIDDLCRVTGDLKEYSRNLSVFQRQVWERLFGERYSALPLEQYVLRVDKEFEFFPDSPNLWTVPNYSSWPPGFKGRDLSAS